MESRAAKSYKCLYCDVQTIGLLEHFRHVTIDHLNNISEIRCKFCHKQTKGIYFHVGSCHDDICLCCLVPKNNDLEYHDECEEIWDSFYEVDEYCY